MSATQRLMVTQVVLMGGELKSGATDIDEKRGHLSEEGSLVLYCLFLTVPDELDTFVIL